MTDGRYFFSLSALKAVVPSPGIERRAAVAERAMLTFFTFQPGSTVPEHSHPHDQLSVVVRGRVEFTAGGESMILGPGEGASLPGGTVHGVRILEEETEIWDAWAPFREDYIPAMPRDNDQ